MAATAVHIYALVDPRDGQPRYVGKTVAPVRRLKHHVYLATTRRSDEHCARWIRELLGSGATPQLTVLETVGPDAWVERERFWIAHLREQGHPLTNITAGGEGVDAPRTQMWRNRIGAAHKGKTVSPAAVEAMRQGLLANHAQGCKHGHAWTLENTGRSKRGYRVCRACMSEAQKIHKRKYGLYKGRQRQACKQGHPLEGDNLRLLTRRNKTERICRECVRIRNRAAKRRARSTKGPTNG